MKGLTLLELVLAVAIVAILVSLAVPGYRAHLVGVHRTEAIAALLGVAACQERVFAVTGRYDTTRCLPAASKRYRLRMDPADTSDALAFTAWADPLGAQQNDPCGSLGLDQTGLRQVSGEGADAQRCWNGRGR